MKVSVGGSAGEALATREDARAVREEVRAAARAGVAAPPVGRREAVPRVDASWEPGWGGAMPGAPGGMGFGAVAPAVTEAARVERMVRRVVEVEGG